MGEQITRDYKGRRLLLIGALKGAFVVMADLSRLDPAALEFDFMAISPTARRRRPRVSCGSSRTSSST